MKDELGCTLNYALVVFQFIHSNHSKMNEGRNLVLHESKQQEAEFCFSAENESEFVFTRSRNKIIIGLRHCTEDATCSSRGGI